jgi:hypothetical protein
VFVLGVDEHTALCLDLDAGTAVVAGRGGVTVRARGHSTRIESGQTLPIDHLAEMADDLAHSSVRPGETPQDAGISASGPGAPPVDSGVGAPVADHGSPLLDAIRNYEATFRAARDAGDAPTMVETVLALEDEMWSWRADTQQSDEMDRGRAALRSMVHELGLVAESGTRDPATVVGPFVDLALALRAEARTGGRYADADAVRDRLLALGVEVHDTPDGVSWALPKA